MPVTIADIDALYKQRYTSKKVLDLTLRDHPTLAMMPRNTKVGGRPYVVPIIGGNPQGLGSRFTRAQANKNTAGDQKAFTVKRGRVYGVMSIDNEALEASVGDENAFLSTRARMTDGVYQGMAQDLSIKLFRDGTGVKGKIAAAADVGTATVALTNATDVRNFSVNEKVSCINLSGKVYRNPTTDSAGATIGATATIKSIDEDAGTITFTGNLTDAIAAAAAGDGLVRDGDYQASPADASATTITCPMGFDGWLPQTAPAASESFWGVDRSTFTRRYGGVRYNGNGGPLKKTLTKLVSQICDGGGRPNLIVCDFSNWELLETEIEGKRIYIDSPHAGIGFDAIEINGPRGKVPVIADNSCQPDRAYALQLDTWEQISLGAVPKVLDADGNEAIRESTADATEWRFGGYVQNVCHGPGFNGVATF